MSTSLVPAPPELPEITPEEARIIVRARELVIEDQAGLEQAAALLNQGVKAVRKRIADFFEVMKVHPRNTIAEAKASLLTINQQEAVVDEPWAAAERILKNEKIAPFIEQQERVRQAEERRLQAVRDQEAQNAKQREIDAAKAAKLPAKEVKAIRNTPVVAPTVIVPPTVSTQGTGVSMKYDYSAEWDGGLSLENKRKALEHILANFGAFNHIIKVLEPELNRLADRQKESFKFPGFKLRKKPIVSGKFS